MYAQRFGGPPLAHTPLYTGQVFATSEDRFVQFRDRQHVYLIEFPGLFHLTQFVTMAKHVAAGTHVRADDLVKCKLNIDFEGHTSDLFCGVCVHARACVFVR